MNSTKNFRRSAYHVGIPINIRALLISNDLAILHKLLET